MEPTILVGSYPTGPTRSILLSSSRACVLEGKDGKVRGSPLGVKFLV